MGDYKVDYNPTILGFWFHFTLHIKEWKIVGIENVEVPLISYNESNLGSKESLK